MNNFPRGRRQKLGNDSFLGLTAIPVVSIKSVVVFAEDVSPDEAVLVSAFLDATDDDDQAARAALRADRDALAVDDPLRRLYNYMLGD